MTQLIHFSADTKLTSFQRQLNLYGFRRITKGDDHGAYFHPNFQRGRRDLISNIRRLPSKNNRFSVDSFTSENDSVNR
jgi:HSF-type DNA-binding